MTRSPLRSKPCWLRCLACLTSQNDAVAAAQQVRSLMFVKRFRADIGRRLEAYET